MRPSGAEKKRQVESDPGLDRGVTAAIESDAKSGSEDPGRCRARVEEARSEG